MCPLGAAHVSAITQRLPDAPTERKARIKTQAAELLGSVEAAETGLVSPALALGWQQPTSLPATAAGASAVESGGMSVLDEDDLAHSEEVSRPAVGRDAEGVAERAPSPARRAVCPARGHSRS